MLYSPSEATARRVATLLLEAQAIKLSPQKPFQWSSGWLSPIYCDNRIALSYPVARTYIKNQLAQLVGDHFAGVQAIAGVATAGIAQGALVADLLDLPFAYVRPEPKKHGMGNQIEGRLEKGQKVVLVEDLISTGGSSLKVADALREADIDVVGMVAIFSYGFAVAETNFAQRQVALATLSNYTYLIEEAFSQGQIDAGDVATLTDWRKSPETWGR
jgi:orotate phosphoribosyltransferase